MATKWVYRFGDGTAEGGAADVALLGGKGANLAEMASLGLPVPPGMTITTEACLFFFSKGKALPDDLQAQVLSALVDMEKITGRTFGQGPHPLLCPSAPGRGRPCPA